MRTLSLFALLLAGAAPAQERRPNIVFILADDLGYGELGSYGQTKIRTPHLDRLAAEGIRFTDFYSGNAVCAPSRCCLMTGKHAGHAWVRDNRTMKPEGQTPLPDAAVTVAELLKARGYATAAIGKWGLGGTGTSGDPNRQGFDLFYGFNCQGHAHNHYPTYLNRNGEREQLPGNDGTWTGRQFSHDLMETEALGFIESNKEKPFFLYLPFTIPHVSMQVPADSLAEYKDLWDDPPYDGTKGYLPHPKPRAAHAAMITRMDRSVGRILALLGKLGLDRETIVLFTSDNGSIDTVGGHDLAFFQANGPLRGQKGTLFEGGIRVPFLARWPGRIKPGGVSGLPGANYDVLPTLCEIAGAETPKDVDGASLVPTLTGQGGQRKHEVLYWEFPAGPGHQAVRMGDWKGFRTGLKQGKGDLQLYNLATDPGEKEDVAAKHPEIAGKILEIMRREHAPSELFPLKALDEGR